MTNYNWRTKLKMNKSFIKRLITKIRNKKNKNLNWNTKDEEDRHVLLRGGKRRKKEKEEWLSVINCSYFIIMHRTKRKKA
jgi:hypothetical protein